MVKTLNNPTEEYFAVLKKYINICLFFKTTNPKFRKRSGDVKLHENVMQFYASLDSIKNNEEKEHLIQDFLENSIEKFRRSLRGEDWVDLMNCYGFSEVRTLLNIKSLFSVTGNTLNSDYDPALKDARILNEMIWERKIPKEIEGYIRMQFYDILNHLYFPDGIITEEEYQKLLDRYLCKYHYNKVLNIVHQNFEEPE